jgi:hypothetical protein
MFSTYFEKNDTATDDLTITIENQTTSGFIQIENIATKQKMVMSAESY